MTASMNMNALTSSAYIDIMMTSFAISVSIALVSTTMSNHLLKCSIATDT